VFGVERQTLRTNDDITAIYQRHVKTVYRLCYAYLRNPNDAEDAVQNVFIKLINHTGSFESAEHEKAWLITCATNHCKDVLKSAYAKRTDFDVPDVADGSLAPLGGSDVLQAVLALPEKYRATVYLHYYEGYKTDEIARMIDKPGSTVRSYLSEARALLRNTLEGGRNA